METLLSYWSGKELVTNGLVVLHMLGALATGLVIGYERSYHGRAAGLRTYSLVCMASTALTVVNGYPGMWYGGLTDTPGVADPTRAIQGIMTGIGFLGAGVIMKEGFSIRGLSTAASIWVTAAIGVLIGVGFYAAAIVGAVCTVAVMTTARRIEHALPHQTALHLTLTYLHNQTPPAKDIHAMLARHGFVARDWSFQLAQGGKLFEYQMSLAAEREPAPLELLDTLSQTESLAGFSLTPARS
ncbi:Mg(2+) transport ATPase protein C [Paramagnetospirillum magnetotacticum MS-1]|uniref:Protein MgtC n=1 Tax=Paramagnetospirillum magnetotacticum MS-1 TaxID=272627 RepID=A0A0C2YG71_PARME|nr:MgtC/SapB family protein [Paramagnetospirillum magnetotacticum]KIL98759.1 Mg(2+) transport ATPase protein C [Paramagnetospirillum magnetotacticum MS-1]